MFLPDELWSYIFAFLKDAEGPHFDTWCTGVEQELQQLLSLRLICKRFEGLYVQQVRRLSILGYFPVHALPGLLTWMRRSKVLLNTFEASCESHLVDAVLGACAALEMPLSHVHICDIAGPSLELLSAFQGLQSCTLHSETGDVCGLMALEQLPHLTQLTLTGNFDGLEYLDCLTGLTLNDAYAFSTRECNFVSSVSRLDLSQSDFQSPHPNVLAACTNVSVLTLCDSELLDIQGDKQLTPSLSAMLCQLTCLTNLAELTLGFQELDPANLQSISVLTGLKHLSLCFANYDPGSLDMLFRLTMLSSLVLSGSMRDKSTLHIAGDWHKLRFLQQLSIANCQMHLPFECIDSLLQLSQLKHLSLCDVQPKDAKYFAGMIVLIDGSLKSGVKVFADRVMLSLHSEHFMQK